MFPEPPSEGSERCTTLLPAFLRATFALQLSFCAEDVRLRLSGQRHTVRRFGLKSRAEPKKRERNTDRLLAVSLAVETPFGVPGCCCTIGRGQWYYFDTYMGAWLTSPNLKFRIDVPWRQSFVVIGGGKEHGGSV